MKKHLSPRRGVVKRAYVGLMIRLLPTLLAIGSHTSKLIGRETKYLDDGFSFSLVVRGMKKSCRVRQIGGAWKRIPKSDDAPIVYTIEFRDLDYAFDVFTGSLSLQSALSARMFTTRGPNNTGVSLTYMFTAILRTFFGWRTAYRR